MAAKAEGEDARRGALGRGSRLVLALLFLGISWLYLTHPPGRFTVGGRATGDGVYYYVYTRSLVFDRDVDFGNDYALLGEPHEHGEGPRGLPENRFAAGAGILWIPTFLIGEGVARVGTALGWLDDACDGSSGLVQRVTFFASVLWGFAAILLSVRLAARYVAEWIAVTAGVAIVLTSPLLWYMVYQPSWPHATSAFTVAAFVWVWHEGRSPTTERSVKGWAGLGALAGLMVLVRPETIVFLLLPVDDVGRQILAIVRARAGAAAKRLGLGLGLATLCALLVFAPQMWTWATIYGDALVIPQGAVFMRWEASKWVETLFSSRNGLFAWTPLVGLSILGLIGLGLRRPQARVPAGLLLLAFFLQAYVNGSVDDWWGGWAFGGRRFLACTIVFVLGAAYLLHALHRLVRDHGRVVAVASVVGFVALFTSYNASFMWDYWGAEVERGKSQALEGVTQRWAERVIAASYQVIGHPGAIPANLVHGWRAGVSPGRYDATSGWELATDRTKPWGWDQIRFHDPRWAGEGFGEQVTIEGLAAAMVETEAVFVIPIRYATPLEAVFRLRPQRPDTRVVVAVGGEVVVDRVLKPGWHLYRTRLPAAALAPGLNYVTVRQELPERGPAPMRSVGRTGSAIPLEVEVRSDADAEVPLRFVFGRTTIDVHDRGVSLFAIAGEATVDDPGYRALGTFDTTGDPHAVERLAATIAALEPGQVVALGLSRSALERWRAEGDAALAMLGAAQHLTINGGGLGYGLIGARGAAPGSAVEALTETGVAEVRVGRPAWQREEGVAWGELTLWRSELPGPEGMLGRTFLPGL